MFDRAMESKRKSWERWRPRDGAEVWHVISGFGTVVRGFVYFDGHPARGMQRSVVRLADVERELEPGLGTIEANRRGTKS